MLEKFLEEVGFSEKASAIYLYLLTVDSASVADIAKKTKINRTTVYPVLEELKKKEFVEEITGHKKIDYRARTPDRITSYLEEQKIKIEEKTQQAKDMIPQLKGVMRQEGERPIIEYHEGKEAILESIKKYYKEVGEKEVFLIYPRSRIEELFSEKERNNAVNFRVGNKVHSYSIYTDKQGPLKEDDTGERMWTNGNEHPIKADISIYGDSVVIQTLEKSLGSIYIKSADVAITLKSLFKLAFDGLKNKNPDS